MQSIIIWFRLSKLKNVLGLDFWTLSWKTQPFYQYFCHLQKCLKSSFLYQLFHVKYLTDQYILRTNLLNVVETDKNGKYHITFYNVRTYLVIQWKVGTDWKKVHYYYGTGCMILSWLVQNQGRRQDLLMEYYFSIFTDYFQQIPLSARHYFTRNFWKYFLWFKVPR